MKFIQTFEKYYTTKSTKIDNSTSEFKKWSNYISTLISSTKEQGKDEVNIGISDFSLFGKKLPKDEKLLDDLKAYFTQSGYKAMYSLGGFTGYGSEIQETKPYFKVTNLKRKKQKVELSACDGCGGTEYYRDGSKLTCTHCGSILNLHKRMGYQPSKKKGGIPKMK